MEHLKLESITDSPDFWNDPYLISSYCNSILQATKKEEDEVSIMICDYNIVPRVSYDKRNSKNKYSIYLPKLKDFYMNPKIQKDDIKLRKAFLKHELAHIVFSEMETYVEHHKDSDIEIRMLANAIEDVRIEWAFGKRFPGSNDTFFEVQNSFYLKGKSQIENDAPSVLNLSLYFLYRSKKFEFENTLPIQIYDRIFQKYSDFLSLSKIEIIDILKKIQSEFSLEQENLKEEIEEFKENIPEKEKIQMTQKEYDDYTADRDTEENSEGSNAPEIEITDKKNKEPKQNSSFEQESQKNDSKEKDDLEKEKSKTEENLEEDSNESEQDSEDSEQDSEDSEQDSEDSKISFKNQSDSEDEEDSEEEDSEDEEDSIDSEDEEGSSQIKNQPENEMDSESSKNETEGNQSSNQSDSSSPSINNKLDFSDMIKDQMKNNLEKELKNIEEFNSEEIDDIDEKISSLEESIEDPEDSENQKRILNILKIIQPVTDDYISELSNNHNVFEDFLKYNNSKVRSRGSQIVDISRFLSVSSKRKKQTKRGSKNSNVSKRTIYSQIASKNSKNIVGLINFFKLKFQNKEKSKRFFNKEEGDLHNESLYKIFSHEQDKRIFSNLQKSLVIKEDVSFLLDFSGSMTGSKLKYLLESLVILNEVFSKIEIPYNVFSFSGRDPKYYFKYSSFSEKTILSNAFNSKNWVEDRYGDNQISFYPKENKFRDVIFGIINRNSKSEERKKIIELLLEIVFGSKNYSQIASTLIGGGTPEIPAIISLYNNLPKQKLFVINDGEYDSFDFFGKEIKEIKNIDRQNIRNIDYYKIGYTFLSGQKIKINNFQEKNIFNQTIKSIMGCFPYSFKSSFCNKFFVDPTQNNLQDNDINTVQNIIQDLKRFIEDVYFDNRLFNENNSSYSSKNKYFTIEKKYFQGKDSTEINFIINESVIPKFSLKVYSKIINEKFRDWYDDNPIDCNLFLDSDYITDIKDIYKIICFHRASSLMRISERVDLSRYTYRDLISKMRNSGWSVFGLGIESDSGRNYIGEKNFTFIKNHSDIRTNLEKKVKKIVI